MLLVAIAVGGICFYSGWNLKDYKWKSAAKNGKIMVVDGDMFKVNEYIEPEKEEII